MSSTPPATTPSSASLSPNGTDDGRPSSSLPGHQDIATPSNSGNNNKDFYPEARLSFKKFAEHQLRREFKDMAIEKCHDPIREFAECAKAKGLLVVWSCYGLCKKMNACMYQYNSDEAFEKYKQENQDELERRTIRSRD